MDEDKYLTTIPGTQLIFTSRKRRRVMRMLFRKTTERLNEAVAVPSRTAISTANVAMVIGVVALIFAVVALVRH